MEQLPTVAAIKFEPVLHALNGSEQAGIGPRTHHLPPSVKWPEFYPAMCAAMKDRDGIDIADCQPWPNVSDEIINDAYEAYCAGRLGDITVQQLAGCLVSFPERPPIVRLCGSGIPLSEFSRQIYRLAERSVNEDTGSLIGVKPKVLVPGGRFEALFGWDSLPVQEGALTFGEEGIAYLDDCLDAFAEGAQKLDGNVPNVLATWGADRAHPNVTARLIIARARQEKDKEGERRILFKYQRLLEDQLAYLRRGIDRLGSEPGSNYRYLVRMPNGSVMYRFYDEAPDLFGCLWRDEMYMVDLGIKAQLEHYLGRSLTPAESKELAINIRTGAASGEDFNAAQSKNRKDIFLLHPIDLVSVKQNSLQHDALALAAYVNYERAGLAQDAGERDVYLKIAKDYEQQALELSEGINAYCISKEGFPADFDFVKGETEPGLSMTGIFALSSGIIPYGRSEAMLEYVDRTFLREGGFINTLYESDMQWDGNAWPIMELQTVRAAVSYGRFDLALKWCRLLIDRNETAYRKWGMLFERYDPNNCGEAGGAGEYDNVANLLMSHGQHLVLADMLPWLERKEQEWQLARRRQAARRRAGKVAVRHYGKKTQASIALAA